jgi:ADP-heptose:LPS heptosyltransferase
MVVEASPPARPLWEQHRSLYRQLRKQVRRIVVVRALFLGDLLVATPALRTLRQAFPEAEITFVGLPWSRALVERLDSVDRFLEFPGWPGIPEVPVDRTRIEVFCESAAAERFDLAIQLHGNGTHLNQLMTRLGARWTLGYVPDDHPGPLDFSLPYPAEPEHIIHTQLRLLERIGIAPSSPRMELPLADEDFAELGRWPGAHTLEAPGLKIGIHPGAKFPSRRWDLGRFAEVADRLHSAQHARIVLLGGPSDELLVEGIAALMRARPLNLAGHTSVGALGAAISRLDLLICLDSGPFHVACALGTPTVVLFGPGDQRRWGPLDPVRHRVVSHPVPCAPCPHEQCPIEHPCLELLTASQVYEAAQAQIEAPVFTS